MAGPLLSNQEILDIRAAMKLVTDQFMVTPVTYELKGESLDVWNEDRQDQQNKNFYFKALVEYEFTDADKAQLSMAGALDKAGIKISMNLEDLQAMGFVNSKNLHIGKEEKDYFTTNGEYYRVRLIMYDGPLEQKNVLLIIFGEQQERRT